MKIETKFNVGDTVTTINTATMKLTTFEVGRITTWTDGESTSATLYPKDCSYSDRGYDEAKCFATEQDLLRHLTA